MRILALDSAVGRCSATILVGDKVIAGYQQDIERGQASILPVMTQDCLRDSGLHAADLDLIAVTVGPGSFTGIRGGIALAQGIAVATGRPVLGVTVGEALAASLPHIGARTLWCAVPSRRGRIFLEIGGAILSLPLNELPQTSGPVAIAGNAAADVASRLAARGVDVMLTDARLPTGRYIALVAEQRFHGAIRPLAAEPLYVDPPEARPAMMKPPADTPPAGSPV